MKNLGLLILFFSAVIFSSCGDDLEMDILGTWNATLIQFSNCADEDDNLIFAGDNEGCAVFDGDMTCFSFTFSEGGTMSVTSTVDYGGIINSDTTNGSYTLDGDNITFNLDGSFSGTASVDGNQLEIIGTAAQEFNCDFTFRMVK